MDVILKETETSIIVDLREQTLTPRSLRRLESIIRQKSRTKPCALNMSAVETVCEDFFGFLRRLQACKLALINLPANIFTLLNLTSYDKFARIFLTEYDFLEDRRMIINRKFSLLRH